MLKWLRLKYVLLSRYNLLEIKLDLDEVGRHDTLIQILTRFNHKLNRSKNNFRTFSVLFISSLGKKMHRSKKERMRAVRSILYALFFSFDKV